MTIKAPDTRQAATSLIDESVHRLRLAPAGTLPIYYAGALPFILTLLYFWADQAHSPDAEAHGSAAALGIAGLFLWMKICQAVFAARLSASIRRRPGAPWTWARAARVAAVQTALQPSGLFVLCLAMLPAVLQLPAVSAFALSLLLTIPFGWTYAFYQNVTVVGDGGTGSFRAVFSQAWRHTLDQPKQNHTGLGVLSLLALFAWINLIALAFFLPQLAHMFTGEENVFTRSGMHLLNTTFFAVTGALVYLTLDPLAKTFYVLRCFYLDSLRTGEDLKSELAALPAPATGLTAGGSRAVVAALALMVAGGILLAGGSPARAAYAATPAPALNAPPAPVPGSVSPPELGRSIENVLRRREFAWRAPRSADAVEKAGPFNTFFDDFNHWWKERQATMGRWLDELMRKFSGRNRDDAKQDTHSSGLDPATLRAMLYTLTGLLAALLVFLVWRHLRGSRPGLTEGKAAPAPAGAAPDLTDDAVLASQLPEDEWLQLARGLLDGGDRRLALRAFYLSVLAGLGERGLLAIARHKSNRDYLLELRRRARDRDEMQGAFARNVGRFERVWYGEHPADDALLEAFQADRQRVLG